MEFYCWPISNSIRILMVNPLAQSSRIAILRILSGSVFGMQQLIDLKLLVYSNELQRAEEFIQELIGCSFGCLNSIVATSDLPSLTDADIFCFMSEFPNTTSLPDNLDTEAIFDTTYLILKVARSLGNSIKENKPLVPEKEDPIIIADGLIVLDMVYTMGNIDIPSSRYFCATSLGTLAKTVLSELLKVKCSEINRAYVWGVNDRNFHVEIDKPYVIYDTISDKTYCDWEMVSKELLEPLKLDHTQFNASWMKKEFIDKLKKISSRNPYGQIFRGWKLAKCLTNTWKSSKSGTDEFVTMGVISDGSFRTLKGLPYYLPVIFTKHSRQWQVDTHFEELSHVKQEIGKFNIIAKKNHERLVKYCTKFIEDNIINQEFIPPDDDESCSVYSSSQTSQFN